MKKLSIFVMASFLPWVSFAQEDTEVVISATRLPQSAVSELASVEIVTKQQLELHNAKTLKDALELLPGIQFISNGGRGQSANFYVRGSKAEHVLVLLDGQVLNSAGIAAVTPNSIPANVIEKVEFIRGQKATLYGANAMVGVINIITKPEYKKQQSLSYTYSTYNTHDLNFKNIFTITDTDVLKVSGGIASSDGYNVRPQAGLNDGDEHGFKNRNFNIQYAHYFANDLELWGSYNYIYTRGDYDNSYYDYFTGSPIHEMDRNEVERNLFALGLQYITDTYSFNISGMYSRNNDYNYPKLAEKLGPSSSAFKVDAFTFNAINKLNFLKYFEVSFGVDFDNNILDSSSNSYGSTFGNDDVSIVNRGAFIGLNVENDLLIGDVSFRVDDNSVYDTRGSYSVGAGIKPIKDHLLSVRYGTSFRSPTMSELYYPYYGNKNLSEEEAEGLEISFKGHVDNFRYYLNGYYNEYEDLISYDYSKGYVNISKAEIKGIELGLGYSFDYLQATLSADLLDPKNKDNNEVITYRSKQNYKAQLSGQYQRFDYALLYTFNSKRYTSSEPLGSYGVLNIGAGVTLADRVRFMVKVDNLFDKEYENMAGYKTGGRIVYGGIELKNFW